MGKPTAEKGEPMGRFWRLSSSCTVEKDGPPGGAERPDAKALKFLGRSTLDVSVLPVRTEDASDSVSVSESESDV